MFIAPGSSEQIVVALHIVFFLFAAHCMAWPMKQNLHNWVKAMSEAVIFIVLVSVLVCKPALLEEQQVAMTYLLAIVVAIMCSVMGVMTVIVGYKTAMPFLNEIRGTDSDTYENPLDDIIDKKSEVPDADAFTIMSNNKKNASEREPETSTE